MLDSGPFRNLGYKQFSVYLNAACAVTRLEGIIHWSVIDAQLFLLRPCCGPVAAPPSLCCTPVFRACSVGDLVSFPQTNAPTSTVGFDLVRTGNTFACAIERTSTRRVKCW